MSRTHQPDTNRLLAALPAADYQHFMERSRAAELRAGDALADRGQPFHDVYFPTEGYMSLIRTVDKRPGLEVGVVGNEGMVGAMVALDAEESANEVIVQGVGAARAMGAATFGEELTLSEPLARIVRDYLQVMMGQLGQTAACMRFHRVGARLARWLLNAHDRVAGEEIVITHEELAGLLGVRRVGVTGAASALQRQKLIRYRRGRVIILDRAGLEATACGCYSDDRALYSRIMRL